MKITIHSTSKIVELRNTSGDAIAARLWEGETETGIPVHCFITRIAPTIEPHDPRQAEFGNELAECKPPSAIAASYPARMII